MNGRLSTILSEKNFFYMLILFVVIGIGLFVFVQSSVNTFKTDNIRKNMQWMGNSIKYFCSSGYDQLAKVGYDEDQIQVILKQADVLEMVEDFARNNDFRVEVYELTDTVPLVLFSSFSSSGEMVEDVVELPLFQVLEVEVEKQKYNGFIVPFEAWSWRVMLLRDAKSYDNLLVKLRGFYLALGLLVVMLVIVVMLFLRQSRKASRILQIEQQKLQATLDSLSEGVMVIDSEGQVIQINPSAKDILGVCENDVCLGVHISEILSLKPLAGGAPLDRQDFEEGGGLHIGGQSNEYVLVNRQDEEKLVDVRFTRPTPDSRMPSREALVLSFDDITQHRKIERKLQQAQKMEVVGLMAGGVAHDLNNILSGIVSYPDLILLKLEKDSELRKLVEAIKQSGERAAAVVADLLTVARGAASKRETLLLNTLIEEYLQSPECLKLQKQHKDVTVKVRLAPKLGQISCSPVHIKKCLFNLILNAFEAIENTGVCTILSKKEIVGKQQAERLHLTPGDYAIMAVSDNGSGIAGDHIGHIFDPFYTKKKMGRSGTGLGLSVVWNTMQDHQGIVVVKSGIGGTAFELYFPAVSGYPVKQKEVQSHANLNGSGERILIVDDDPLQRDIATDFLVELKYEAESVSSGEEAIERVDEESFDLIVLDMIMDPGMNGRKTFEKILEVCPGQKAIIVSGYSESEDVTETLALGAGGFLKKPYSLSQLGISVQELLIVS